MNDVECPHCGKPLTQEANKVKEGQEYQDLNCIHVYRGPASKLDEDGLLKEFIKTEWNNPATNISQYSKAAQPSPDWLEKNAEHLLPSLRLCFQKIGDWWLVKDVADRVECARHIGLEITKLTAAGI